MRAFFILIVCFCFLSIAISIKAEEKCILVVISGKLRPYWLASEGLKEKVKKEIKGERLITIFAEKYKKNYQCSINVAIGSKAVYILNGKEPKICSLILYPWLLENNGCVCGIFLEITPELYIDAIKTYAPWIKNIAIIYSDEKLKGYVDEIKVFSKDKNLNIKELRIASIKELIKRLKEKSDVEGVILIPDPIFSTEAVIRLVVSFLSSQKKLVVGYNRFFLELGAAISIVTDYKKTGEKLAEIIMHFIRTGNCTWTPAIHRILINEKILKEIARSRYEHK